VITQNDVYFILSLICLGLSVFFLPLTMYLFPAACFGWVYHLPNFAYSLHDWFQAVLGIDENSASWVVVYLFFLLFVLFSGCTYYFSVKAKEGLKQASTVALGDEHALRSFRDKQERRETLLLVIKMILIISLVFVIAELVHYAISITPIR